jgi:hypothetical protein
MGNVALRGGRVVRVEGGDEAIYEAVMDLTQTLQALGDEVAELKATLAEVERTVQNIQWSAGGFKPNP